MVRAAAGAAAGGGERTAPPEAKGNLLRKVSFRILPKLFSTDHV